MNDRSVLEIPITGVLTLRIGLTYPEPNASNNPDVSKNPNTDTLNSHHEVITLSEIVISCNITN